MSVKDYYAVLGARKDDSPEVITKKYRSLSMEFHPDRNKGSKESEKRIKEINEAYSVLKDEEKRRAYDRSRLPVRTRPRRRYQPPNDVFYQWYGW